MEKRWLLARGCLAWCAGMLAAFWLPGNAGAQAPADSSWPALVGRADAAIGIGDGENARLLLDRLDQARPSDPLPVYLRARLLEREGAFQAALGQYGALLGGRPEALPPDWIGLVAGRWVRAGWERDEAQLRAMEGGPAGRPDRCVVFPLEPLVLAGEDDARNEVDALGVAAAAWVIADLAPRVQGEIASLHAGYRLLRRAAPPRKARVADTLPEDSSIPPVTTLSGVARRLEGMEPKGAPPWAPEGARPSRYLVMPSSGMPSADAVARSLAHFQSEHEIAPTGVLDAETRVALERAYRDSRATSLPRGLVVEPGTDPLRAGAVRYGAAWLLTGTMEPLASGDVRWNAAWVSTADGTVVSPPIAGVLPRAHFPEAWQLMIDRITEASPFSPGPRVLGEREAPPEREAAVAYGQAMLLLEAGQTAEAVRLFRHSAKQGGGALARWAAASWGISPESMYGLERRLIGEAIHGPRRVPAADLRLESLRLAQGLPGLAVGGRSLAGDWLAGQPLASIPFSGWLSVGGRVGP